MRILLCGGAGYIGAHAYVVLVERGHDGLCQGFGPRSTLGPMLAEIGLGAGGGQFEEWRSALASSGNEQRYFEKYPELSARSVVDFLLFDLKNGSNQSIFC